MPVSNKHSIIWRLLFRGPGIIGSLVSSFNACYCILWLPEQDHSRWGEKGETFPMQSIFPGIRSQCHRQNANVWNATDFCVWGFGFWGWGEHFLSWGFGCWRFVIGVLSLAFCPKIIFLIHPTSNWTLKLYCYLTHTIEQQTFSESTLNPDQQLNVNLT